MQKNVEIRDVFLITKNVHHRERTNSELFTLKFKKEPILLYQVISSFQPYYFSAIKACLYVYTPPNWCFSIPLTYSFCIYAEPV